MLESTPKGLKYSRAQIDAMPLRQIQSAKNSNLKSSGIQSSTFPSTGKRKLLMILVNFSDRETVYTQKDFENYMNEPNYKGVGSFRDFYLENSYGQLDITTTVTRWVTLSRGHDFYGRDDDKNAYQAIIEAIDILDGEIDFSEFDNDGDGIVDGLAVIHQGQGQEFSGSDVNNIWSHSWSLSSALYPKNPPKKDGVYIDSYTIQPEIMAGKNNTLMSTIGVMCHEFGHNLGAPDYYDTDGDNNGTGQWDLMAAGSWNGTSGNKPAHFTAYQKAELGWLNLVTLKEAADIELKPISKYPQAYKIHTATPGEFFVLENRQKNTSFESGLPGKGMIVYHVDENHIRKTYYKNEINVGYHQGMYPIVAKGDMRRPNSAACPFPGSGRITSLTDLTTPSTLSWSGLATNKPIENIAEAGENIVFSLGIGANDCVKPVELIAEYKAARSIKLKWAEGVNTQFRKYNIYRNGTLIVSGVNGLEFTDNNALLGVNHYSVRNVSDNGQQESEEAELSLFCESADSYKALNPSVSIAGKNIGMVWNNPVVIYDSFEDMKPFVVDPTSGNNWTYIDGDGTETRFFNGLYQNKSSAKSFVCFNPEKSRPIGDYVMTEPLDGKQYMVSFASAGQTDDWMVSKELNLTSPHRLVFHARGKSAEGTGENVIDVAVSSTDNSKESFSFVNGGNSLILGDSWTRYEFDIPAGTKYFAIHCGSGNGFAALIDELSLRMVAQSKGSLVSTAGVYPPSDVSGFNIYRNKELIFSNIKTPSFVDEIQVRGSYEYIIESLVGANNLPFTRLVVPVLVKETAVPQPAEVQKDIALYPNPASSKFSINGGGHIVELVEIFSMAGNLVVKSSSASDIDVASLPAGYYIVKIKTDRGSYVKRLQKR